MPINVNPPHHTTTRHYPQSTKYGYGKNFALQTNQRKVVQHQGMQGWSQHKLGRRGWRYEYFKEGGPEEKNVKKIMWGDFAAKMPTSVYFQPGVINGTDPNEQGLIKKPIAPEFAGSYEARPWVAPDVFPDNHPLTRMPAPVRNVVAQAERKKNFWSKDQWYEMAEGEVLCPFEVLEFDVRRAGMMMKGGRHMRTLVTVIVSNGNGVAGLGVGEGRTYEEARQAGIRYAFGNLIARDPDDRTVPHPVYENFNETRVSLLPANTLACSPVVADVMSGFGFQGASVKIKRSRHRKYKKLMTLFAAIRQVCACDADLFVFLFLYHPSRGHSHHPSSPHTGPQHEGDRAAARHVSHHHEEAPVHLPGERPQEAWHV